MAKQSNVVVYHYGTVLSYVMDRFLDDFNDYIIREHGEIYIFSRNYETKYLVSIFMDYINEFFANVEHYGTISTVVVGTCYPHHNWMARFAGELQKKRDISYLKKHVPVRYVFRDRSYVCDESMLNALFDSLITNLIKGVFKVFTPNYRKIVWIFSKNMSETDLGKIITYQHSDINTIEYGEHELLVDVNNVVFSDIRKHHYIPADVKEASLYMYELIRESGEELQ